MALILVLGSMTAAFAATTGTGGTPTTPTTGTSGTDIIVNGYRVFQAGTDNRIGTISKDTKFDIEVTIKDLEHAGKDVVSGDIDISRVADNFTMGDKVTSDNITLNNSASTEPFSATIKISGLEYSGTGNTLKLLIGIKGKYQKDVVLSISECKEYTEPTVEPTPTPTPEAIPAPKVIVTRNELGGDVKAGDELMLTVSVKNIGRTAINNPILSFTPSDSILVTSNDSALQMNSIGVGRTETAQIKVRVLDPVASVNQYLDAKLEFTYYNNVTTTVGEASARIGIPAKVKKKTEDTTDDTTASPLPNIIVSRFNYGGGSVAAGSKFNLSFKFRNTSSTVNVENMVITVTGGEGLTINGSSNTFFYDKVKAGQCLLQHYL